MNLAVILASLCTHLFDQLGGRGALWRRVCPCDLCRTPDYTEYAIDIIPEDTPPPLKQSRKDFTQNRDLPLPEVLTFRVSLAAVGTNQGVGPKAGQFFKNARWSGLWVDAQAVHRRNTSRGRSKVPWQVLVNILSDAVETAYGLWPRDDSKYLRHGTSVYAMDGSRYNLPARDEIRAEFDPYKWPPTPWQRRVSKMLGVYGF